MSLEPEIKRRKMEPHVSGDDYNQEVPQVSGVLASKNLARAASASPSGDFGDTSHQFVALVSSESQSPYADETETNRFDMYQQVCEYGDSWGHKYKIPLSKCPQRPIRTGNKFYDGVIGDLDAIGYKPLHVVARGKSGTIILAQNLHQTQHFQECETVPVAIKLNSGKPRRCANRLSAKAEMLEEMVIHRELHHSNIVTWLSNIDHNGRVGTVMEYCENGTLDELLKLQNARFVTEGVARRYFRQIHSAVNFIHQQGFAHRDICPQNILLTQNNVPKLCDFGHAVRSNTTTDLCEDECGSLGYQAPEILRKTPYNPKLVDIWSLGATLYSLCTGRPPLGTIRSDILENASKEIKFPDQRIMTLTPHFRSLVKGHLASIPNTRFSLNRIAHSIWMTKADTKVQIGNFFRVRQPQKTNEGSLEHEIKTKLCI